MIDLGCFDVGVSESACNAYLGEVAKITRLPLSEVTPGPDRLAIHPMAAPEPGAMSVAEVQRGLTRIGFFPGGKDDGICGYRTLSALRLFQEYVRSVEKLDCTPDGRFGPQSQAHLRRWLSGSLQSVYAPTLAQWQAGTLGDGEYTAWLSFLNQVKQRRLADPGPLLAKVNAFPPGSDSHPAAEWNFDTPGTIHLVGVRRNITSGIFDDIFVLLMKGLVFKFQGSTDPGVGKDGGPPPFLVPGQHDYHFGWHKHTYLALRPQGKGVLVVRSKNGLTLDEADLANPLETNGTINVHWGGRGMGAKVNNWSEGCQVINGTVYINPADELINCSAFAALNNDDVAAHPDKTRGAYNVLLDLVTALSGDLPSATVKYTLLDETDLELAPARRDSLADARARVTKLVTG